MLVFLEQVTFTAACGDKEIVRTVKPSSKEPLFQYDVETAIFAVSRETKINPAIIQYVSGEHKGTITVENNMITKYEEHK